MGLEAIQIAKKSFFGNIFFEIADIVAWNVGFFSTKGAFY